MTERRSLADVLREEMTTQRLSLNELASRSQLSVGRIYDILSGRTRFPRWDTLWKLLHGLDRDYDWLETQLELKDED